MASARDGLGRDRGSSGRRLASEEGDELVERRGVVAHRNNVEVVGSDEAWERMLVATAQPGADVTVLGQLDPGAPPSAR